MSLHFEGRLEYAFCASHVGFVRDITATAQRAFVFVPAGDSFGVVAMCGHLELPRVMFLYNIT